MVATLFDLTPLRPALTAGEQILTANDRLRRHILHSWNQEQGQRTKTWRTPALQALNHWLQAQWDYLVQTGNPRCRAVIAGRHQRQLLWEAAIMDAPDSELLLQAEPLAKDADAALRSLELWDIDPSQLRDLEAYPDSNTEQFHQWFGHFQEKMADCDLITPETAHRLVLQAFETSDLPRAERFWLYGFDDLPPLYQRLLEAAATELVHLPPAALPDAKLTRTEAPDSDAEIRAAALWSLAQLEQNPEATIGIIVPDLGQRRAQVERLFSDVFEPNASVPETPRYTLPFNFSAGQPLGSTPLVQTALALLQLGRDQAELENFCTLLQSPFWGDAEAETARRIQLAERLRRLGKFTLTGSDWRHCAQKLWETQAQPGQADGGDQTGESGEAGELKETKETEESLANRLLQLDHHRRRQPKRLSATAWAEQFQQQLNLLGWPGTRRLDSQEYQQTVLWYELLENFGDLDITGTTFTLTDALNRLNQLAQQTPFQAQTPHSPIQILGALEGAGLRFSHCWVVGLHHRQWPPVPNPNPLLPITLQRDRQMPHASAERELTFARSLTDNYRHCASHVVFSSPAGEDGDQRGPSPLIRSIPLTPLAELTGNQLDATQEYRHRLTQARQLEAVDCATGPAPNLTQPAPGGSSLFKHQAACPFNAFAQLRLGARRVDPPVPGLSPAERGTVLHDALARVWRHLKNSQALTDTQEANLASLIAESCEQALTPFRRRRPRELGPTYCALELERLQALIERWLMLERQRPPFEVIGIEERREINFQGLRLTLRIDRIDALPNGDRLLIDYKTGEPHASGWLGERPDEPQLPLYAVTQPADVKGLAFAQLNPKALKWIGMGELEAPVSGVAPGPETWPEMMQGWEQVLETLADEFKAGDARVAFKDTNAQRYSEDLRPLNRAPEAEALREFLAASD